MSQTSEKIIVGTILVDRSDSMKNILPTLTKSLHTFIDEMKKTSEHSRQCYFRLSTFCCTRHTVFPIYEHDIFGDIKTLNNNDITFNTYGCTKLIDSAIQEVDILSKKLDELSNKDTMSWFVLLTDGEDNLSNNTSTALKDKITALKERGVCCMFMGANIDAIKNGIDFGFEESHSLQVELNVVQYIDSAPLMSGFRAVSDNITQTFFDDTFDSSFSTMQRTYSAPNMNNTLDDDIDFDTTPPTLTRSSNLPDIPLSPIPQLEDDFTDIIIEEDEFEQMVEALNEM
jgi:uncharacterized protein YegL